jgi:hypothetical protein
VIKRSLWNSSFPRRNQLLSFKTKVSGSHPCLPPSFPGDHCGLVQQNLVWQGLGLVYISQSYSSKCQSTFWSRVAKGVLQNRMCKQLFWVSKRYFTRETILDEQCHIWPKSLSPEPRAVEYNELRAWFKLNMFVQGEKGEGTKWLGPYRAWISSVLYEVSVKTSTSESFKELVMRNRTCASYRRVSNPTLSRSQRIR